MAQKTARRTKSKFNEKIDNWHKKGHYSYRSAEGQRFEKNFTCDNDNKKRDIIKYHIIDFCDKISCLDGYNQYFGM
jgi:hypothetical protein